MIYIVSGRDRSGTSLMMEILRVAGLDLVYDKSFSNRICSINGNPYAYENYKLVHLLDFKLLDKCEGKAVKIFVDGLAKIDSELETKVIFMYRDIELIEKSMKLSASPKNYKILDSRIAELKKYPLESFLNKHNMLVVTFDSLIDFPVKTLRIVKEFLELDFDVDEAAKVVDPNRRRFIKDG